MDEQRRVMNWREVAKSLKLVTSHALLFSFTLLLLLKLCNDVVSFPWWIVFIPLWLFHVVVARSRFSIPAPLIPCDRYWVPFHSVVATPLLVAFELLLCIYLDGKYALNLKIVFSPLLALETAIFVDNARMFKALLPGDEVSVADAAILKALPHLWIAFSMIFFIAGTTFTLLKLCDDSELIFWWEIFLNYGFAQLFAFFTCTNWHNPLIHRHSQFSTTSSNLAISGYLDCYSGLDLSSNEEHEQSRRHSLQVIGGHVMKVPLIVFQILLFIRLQLSVSRYFSMPFVFSPLLLLQGAGLFFAVYRLVENIILKLHRGDGSPAYFKISSKAHDLFAFMHHGSRLLGWWSIDEGSREEQARLYCAGLSGYNTFSPDVVKKMSKASLTEEISKLQAALGEQIEIRKFSQEEYERLQNEKILCQICFEEQINVVLLPCRHRILCRSCCQRCKRCPICRIYIVQRLCVDEV
ncbi:uncharacterized protein LOC141673941 [Apium graveolens]|uniref:uncharacterized protein LOC141673941 n=1 Tax=Apium graveolens TaxID=4045 RepID=UPI003D7B9592